VKSLEKRNTKWTRVKEGHTRHLKYRPTCYYLRRSAMSGHLYVPAALILHILDRWCLFKDTKISFLRLRLNPNFLQL